MLKESKLIFIVLIFLGLTQADLSAKELKIGTVDIQAVLEKMPQREAKSRVIEDQIREQWNPANKILEEVKYNTQLLESKQATLSETQKNDLEKKIDSLRIAYEEIVAPIKTKMDRQVLEMNEELLAKIEQAVEWVTINEGYDFVFHRDALFFTPHSHVDITSNVLKKAKTL
jgi:outer membrane protein